MPLLALITSLPPGDTTSKTDLLKKHPPEAGVLRDWRRKTIHSFTHITEGQSSGGFPGGSVVKNVLDSTGDVRDLGLTPGLGRTPREGNGNPLQYSCLENPIDRGSWWATVYGVTERSSFFLA